MGGQKAKNFHLKSKVDSINKNNNKVVVNTTNDKGANVKHDCDVVLISVGRKPYTENLNLSTIGVQIDKKGRIKVNKNF